MAWETKMVPVRDGRFSIETRIAGEGEPFVFLHGAGGNAGPIDGTLEALSQHYKVYVPSAPGWDNSDGGDEIDNVIDMALFYTEYFDELGLSSFNLMGASMGGMFAAEIAAISPQYVKKLILAAPAGLWSDDIKTADFYTMGEDELMHALFVNPPPMPPPGPPPEDEASRKAFMQATLTRAKAAASSTKYLWPIWDKGLKKRIHRIKAPTLIIWGDKDGINPAAYGPLWEKSIRGSKLVTLPDAAHVTQAEKPEEVSKLILDFLK